MKIKSKYFEGIDENDCLVLAQNYFGKDPSLLFTRVVRDASEIMPMLFYAADLGEEKDAALASAPADFALYHEPAGVFLEIYPRMGIGEELRKEALIAYLARKKLTSLNLGAINSIFEAAGGRALIAPAQPETVLSEEAAVLVSDKEETAFIRLLPADPGGSLLTEEKVLEALRAAGVVHGIDREKIAQALSSRMYGQNFPVAFFTPPQNGENAKLIFHFEREKTKSPRVDSDGRVDYKALDLFESVTAGQKLVTRVPPTPGVPGYSVKGRELKPLPGKDTPLPKGKNIRISEDKTELFSTANGMVEAIHGTVNVSNVYAVKGDANLGVGNLDFDGNILISENVISGLTLKATGSIEVGGVVEGAEILSGGNVVLKRGIQGMDKGRVSAAGNVVSGYVERAVIVAGGSVTANIVAHSHIECGGSLLLSGKIGSVVGGSIKAGKEVRANVLGSVSNTLTDIEVGVPPQKRSRQKFLIAEITRQQQGLKQLEVIANYLEKLPAGHPKRLEAEPSVLESKGTITQLLADYTEELNNLNAEFENAIFGKVHVRGTVYPGVRITIATSTYRVTTPMEYCTFKIIDGALSFVAFEG